MQGHQARNLAHSEICEKFTFKHSETTKYVKTSSLFKKFHWQITQKLLGLRMQNFQGIVFI